MIYFLEDDNSIRELVVYTMNSTGFEAVGFGKPGEFWAAMERETPSLVLLDIMLPEEDGLSILKKLRANPATKRLPVMMLTAKDSEYDKVLGLDSGADDYVPKPFGMMELMARIKALLRRSGSTPEEGNKDYNVGKLYVSPSRHQVKVDGNEVSLTLKEFELLCFLLENDGMVLTRDKILARIWGYDFDGETRTVEIPLTGPLFTGDMVALAADGSVTETHLGTVKLTVDGSENWISWTNPRDTADITVPGTIGSLGDILCSHYSPLAGTLSSDAGLYTVSTNTTAEPGKTRVILRHGFKTLALFKEYLKAQADAGTPVTFVYKLTPATETPTVTKRTAEPLCAVPDADGLCTVQGGGTLTVTGYEDPRATRRALEKRIAALEAKA